MAIRLSLSEIKQSDEYRLNVDGFMAEFAPTTPSTVLLVKQLAFIAAVQEYCQDVEEYGRWNNQFYTVVRLLNQSRRPQRHPRSKSPSYRPCVYRIRNTVRPRVFSKTSPQVRFLQEAFQEEGTCPDVPEEVCRDFAQDEAVSLGHLEDATGHDQNNPVDASPNTLSWAGHSRRVAPCSPSFVLSSQWVCCQSTHKGGQSGIVLNGHALTQSVAVASHPP